MNLIKIILVLAISCCFNLGFAQNKEMMEKHRRYNTFMQKGLMKETDADYLKAIPFYDSAAFLFPHFHKPYYQLISCYLYLHNYQAAYDNLVKETYTGMKFSKTNFLEEYKNEPLIEKFLKEEDSLLCLAMQKFDTSYGNLIIRLCAFQQTNIRRDTIAFHQLVELCHERGFPTYKKVGTTPYRRAISIISNSVYTYPSDDWEILLPILKHEIEQGEIEVEIPCVVADSDLKRQKKPVKYGVRITSPQNRILPPLEQLNKDRAEAGLSDFELQEEVMRKMGILNQ